MSIKIRMDTYANILLITIPIFLVLITIEILYGAWKKDQQHTFMDTISNAPERLFAKRTFFHVNPPSSDL